MCSVCVFVYEHACVVVVFVCVFVCLFVNMGGETETVHSYKLHTSRKKCNLM